MIDQRRARAHRELVQFTRRLAILLLALVLLIAAGTIGYAAIEGMSLRDEADLLAKFGAGAKGGSPAKSTLVLMDSRGKEFSSEQFAKFLGDYQDRNPLPLVFAVGPADGFSNEAKSAAQSSISLGKMTLAHELARVVLLEQVYRGHKILAGEPYHY